MGEYYHQSQFVADPDAPVEKQGDCWATAVALVLGEPATARDELHTHICRKGAAWFNVTVGWVLLKSLGQLTIGTVQDLVDLPDKFDGELLVASGQSPRGDFLHSVVWHRAGHLVFDPHPSGDGLDGPPTEFDYMHRLVEPDSGERS